jgi:hypothetical protein
MSQEPIQQQQATQQTFQTSQFVEQKPMTFDANGQGNSPETLSQSYLAGRVMNNAESDEFWKSHCSGTLRSLCDLSNLVATMGGHCRFENGVCRMCHKQQTVANSS